MARAARTAKTRSLSPRAVHPIVARSFIRSVEENREVFFDDVRSISKKDIDRFLEKLAPIFEIARSNKMLWQHLAETRARPKRPYTSRSRSLKEKIGPIVLGRQSNHSLDYDTRSLIEYQLRRPDFSGPARIDAIRADIDSILSTGESIREREIKAELNERFGVENYPSFSPALLKFFRGLQQTERYDLLSNIDAIFSHGADGVEAADQTLAEIAAWIYRRSFRACELVFNLERELRSAQRAELSEMAVRYGANDMPTYSQYSQWLTPELRIAVCVAAAQSYLPNRLNNYIDPHHTDIILYQLAAYLAAQQMATTSIGQPDRDHMMALYPGFL